MQLAQIDRDVERMFVHAGEERETIERRAFRKGVLEESERAVELIRRAADATFRTRNELKAIYQTSLDEALETAGQQIAHGFGVERCVISVRGDVLRPAASVMKVPLFMSVYRDALQQDDAQR